MLRQTIRPLIVTFIFCLATLSTLAQSSAPDTYKAKCQMCHGADGAAATPAGKAMKTRSFNDPEVLKEPDAEMIAIIKTGKAKMPSYAAKMSDGEIKAVVAYIHTLQKK
jgi:mono/diheme cytochrome c family protein